MTVLSSRGKFVPVGGWPTAEADLLCEGWVGGGLDLLEPPWRGLSFGDWCTFLRASLSLEVAAEGWLRCDDVRGGGIGAALVEPKPAEAGVLTTGDVWVDGGRACPRGEFTFDGFDAAGDWCICGVVGV
jgi:hypothetical protein